MPRQVDAGLEVVAQVVLSSPQPAGRDYQTKRKTALTLTMPVATPFGGHWKSPLTMSCRPAKRISRSQNRPQRTSEWTC